MMSRRASKRTSRFDVFDFADEDKRVERESAEILGRFKNPKKCRNAPSPFNVYTFRQCSPQQNEISNRAIDPDIEYGSRSKQKEINSGPIELDAEVTEHRFLQSRKTQEMKNIDGPIDVDAKEVRASKTAEKGSRYKFGDTNASVTGQQCIIPAYYPVNARQGEIFDLDTSWQSFSTNYENGQVAIISKNDGRIQMSSSSAFAFSHVECEDSPEEQLSVHGSDGHAIETENVKVVISPDLMLYGGKNCTECQLTFSETSLKFEGLTVNGTRKKFSFERTVGDIISIDAKWHKTVQTAIINLVLQSKSSKRVANANETSAIELLEFVVYDPCWSERQEAIKSLSLKYKDIWNTISDENEENVFMGQHSSFHECFKEVIYPKGDPDAVSISKRDVELLQPETFINDTIIDFYINYLKNKIRPEEQQRFHFFNSFFFRKLADLDKGLSHACQAKAAFQRVRKWTRKVDIFEKDYIFIPVNYSFHWSLIVICHPGEVANFKDDETEKLLKVPCILHMDSIRGSHRGLKNLFQSYLSEEWKERHREATDDVPSKFLHLQFVPLELPQQENSFDCGLFLLHYMELFLLQAPSNFNPFKITRFSNFLNMRWFPPADASLKRSHIQKLIYEILEEQSCSSTSADSIFKCASSLLASGRKQETGVQFFKQIGRSRKTCHGHGHSLNSDIKQESENFSFSAASLPIQGCEDSGLEILECYEVGISGGLLSHGNYQQINTLNRRNAMSPIEEIEETSEEIAADSPSDLDGQQVAGLVSEPCLFMRYPSKDIRVLRTSWNRQMPLHIEDSAFDKPSDSSEIRLEDDQHLPEFEVCSHHGKTDEPESPSTPNEGYSDCIVEDSQGSSGMHDDIESTCSPSSFQRDISALSHQQADLTGKADLKASNMQKRSCTGRG
ncbi:probable ubiquitin-like-specific protease 2A isoform X3 [Herrania umbratica]|uniref:Probable ubiquitin-like-specific protease 2A isoform X3 n=1 Tax=Herrania umbratica TaxID=108875 RepID=A0A6J1AUN5_9ROSI|nr:probable ubiquitin-like-specific protease 2A isoform X3 [Herrania umbratica]